MRLLALLLLLIHTLLIVIGRAQTAPADTVRPGHSPLQTGWLKPGLRQYLVYFQDPKQSKTLRFWYWMRDIEMENRGGTRCFTISQQWLGADTTAYRSVYSVNAAADFAPVYHRETVAGKIGAYNWNAGGVTGADSVEGNARKAFNLAFTEPNYNWNLDIETFEMLPLAKGKSFWINFYDAGLDPPAYYLYTVTGSEELALMNGDRVDCWKLAHEGENKGMKYTEIFWISKKGHEFLKEEDSFNGMYRYKIKMPGMTQDLRERFPR